MLKVCLYFMLSWLFFNFSIRKYAHIMDYIYGKIFQRSIISSEKKKHLTMEPFLKQIFADKRKGREKGNERKQIVPSLILNTLKKSRADGEKDVNRRKRDIQAFFIGPKGENTRYFSELVQQAINSCDQARRQFQLEDTRHITREMQVRPNYLDAQDKLDRELNKILTNLRDQSPPYFSSRYYGHMCWENTIPSLVGYFAGMLYNPNNTAFEASPYTTFLEIDTMKQFADMFDLPEMLDGTGEGNDKPHSWGHLTCGGTVANMEALWAARNCRFLTLSIRKWIESLGGTINDLANIKVKLPTGEEKKVLELTAWELLNIDNDCVMKLYEDAWLIYESSSNPKPSYSDYQNAVAKYSIGKTGIVNIFKWLRKIAKKNGENIWIDEDGDYNIPSPCVLASASKHYSIPKSLSVLGFGEGGVGKDDFLGIETIETDVDGRMRIYPAHENDKECLVAKLQHCVDKHIPVLAAISIIGTTEEGTIDSVEELLKVRAEFATKGLYFHFHIDGAYGGYFCSMLRQKGDNWNSISPYTCTQLSLFHKADSITFDPHKTGYVPYSCGGIIYRNHRLRDNLSFSAPYIYTGAEPNMAIYGIEGSKPGAAVTSVYLSLAVLPLIRSGHGELMERTMINTKIFCSSLYQLKNRVTKYEYTDANNEEKVLTETFYCYQLSRKYTKKYPDGNEAQEEAAYKTISRTHPKDMESVVKKDQGGYTYEKYYLDVGPDTNIPCFGINYEVQKGSPNKSLSKYNDFNSRLIQLSKPSSQDVSVRLKDLFVSETSISKSSYGEKLYNDFLDRHGLVDDYTKDEDRKIVFIRSTIMNAFFTELDDPEDPNPCMNEIFLRELSENACETLLDLNLRS